MAIQAGQRLGPYEILSAMGAGGMGEVYRAHDGRLNRDVALKVLPEIFAADPDRMARFEREARVLGALNHPNIAAIYGLEEFGSSRALVMELVEGETLADRISKGPIPLGRSSTDCEAVGRSAGVRARPRSHSPRPEACECKGDGRRHCEGTRFRFGQGTDG
jgi:serine/threonine protein kinase